MDDDPAAIQLLRSALSRSDDVRFALRTADAWSLLQERPADLIFLDASMPGESGFEFCARLKASPLGAQVPVVFVTAHDDLVFEQRAMEVGASDFLVKPVSAPRVQLRAALHLRLKRQIDELHRLSVTDPLSGLANRRAFDEAIEREWAGARRGRRPLTLIVVDVDFFKKYNDALGHPAGDVCLRRVAEALGTVCRRRTDVAARIGGEEFALLLPDTPLAGAHRVARAAHQAVQALELPHPRSDISSHVTVSVGACSLSADLPTKHTDDHPSVLMTRADDALYRAKAEGRNRVVALSLDSHHR